MILFAELIDALIGQRICSIIVGVTRMTLDPVPVYIMFLRQLIQLQPEIAVFYRLALGVALFTIFW